MKQLNNLVASLIKRNPTISRGDAARAVRLRALDTDMFDRIACRADTDILWAAALAGSSLEDSMYQDCCWLIERIENRHK